ncbi:MAG: HEPN domain-containing protein [Deltaproteobacteria bacterium]|nr:HEPN domain-containing protein [Deltaproteobacteria bacterium]
MSVEEVKNDFPRAKKALKSAQILFDSEAYEDSISRSYYSILHAAKAVLILEGINVKSHSAVRRLFGKHMIKAGKLDVRYAKILGAEQDTRFRADYDAMYIAGAEDAKESVDDARDFLNAMGNYIKTQSIDIGI